MDHVYMVGLMLGGSLLAMKGRAGTEPTLTLSMRVTADEAEQVKIAAMAANLKVGPYIYKRVTGSPILATPALAALAELISVLRRLDENGRADHETLCQIRELISILSRAPMSPGEFT